MSFMWTLTFSPSSSSPLPRPSDQFPNFFQPLKIFFPNTEHKPLFPVTSHIELWSWPMPSHLRSERDLEVDHHSYQSQDRSDHSYPQDSPLTYFQIGSMRDSFAFVLSWSYFAGCDESLPDWSHLQWETSLLVKVVRDLVSHFYQGTNSFRAHHLETIVLVHSITSVSLRLEANSERMSVTKPT